MLKMYKEEKWEYKVITLAVLAAAIFFICRSIYGAVVAFPYPRELLEPANIALTNQFLSGINPYSYEILSADTPGVNFDYPFLNSLIAAALAKIIGCSAQAAHLVISLISIVGSGFIGVLMVKDRAKTSVSPALAAIMFMFCHWRFGYISSAPDDFGLFVFLLTMYATVVPGLRNKPFWCSLGITLCLYIKQYFIFVSIGIFIYMLLYSKKDAVKLLLWTIVINIAVVLVVTFICPLYWTKAFLFTYLAIAIGGGSQIAHVIDQFKYVIVVFAALFAVLIVSVSITLGRMYRNNNRLERLKVKENDALALNTIQTVVMIGPLFVIGRNDGAFLSYFLQLWMPSIVVVTLICFENIKSLINERVFVCIYSILVLFTLYFGFGKLPNHILTSEEIASWDKAYEYIDTYSKTGKIIYSRSLAYESFIRNNGESLCGHDSEVRIDSIDDLTEAGVPTELFFDMERVVDQNLEYRADIIRRAKDHEYSLITFETDAGYTLFNENNCENDYDYRELDKFELRVGNMSYEVAFYIPE